MRVYGVVFILFFTQVFLGIFFPTFSGTFSGAYAQEVIDDVSFHHSTGMNIINNRTTITSPYYSDTFTSNSTSAYYDTYFLYEVIYKQFFFSIAPQYKIQRSENYLLLKEAHISYAFNTVILGVSKTIEQRTLSRHKDYLTIARRDIGYNDAFSFWKANILIPLEFVSIEAGSKFIREEYKLEWKHWGALINSNFIYLDADWKRWSAHAGYAYLYDFDTEQSANHYTFKMLFSYDSIVEFYLANLLEQDYTSSITMKDYSFVLGTGFSLASAMGLQPDIFDIRLDAELIFEEEKYSIAPSTSVVYKIISMSETLRYNIEDDEMVNIASVELNVRQGVTFAVYNIYVYEQEKEDYNNILGMEVSFDF